MSYNQCYSFFFSILVSIFPLIRTWLLKSIEKWARYPRQLSDLLGETGIMEGGIIVNKRTRLPWSLTIKQNHNSLRNERVLAFRSSSILLDPPFLSSRLSCIYVLSCSGICLSLCFIRVSERKHFVFYHLLYVSSYFFISRNSRGKINGMAYVLRLS